MQAFKIFVAKPKWRKFLYKSGGGSSVFGWAQRH